MMKPDIQIRILILSESISSKQRHDTSKYTPSYDIELDIDDINHHDFIYSLFDYDISIIHIKEPYHHSIGYYNNLPKILRDASIALENGRTIICLPESKDFVSKSSNYNGMSAYEWLRKLGIELQDNVGEDIKPSGAGQAKAIQEYLQSTTKYYQIIKRPESPPQSTLAVVDDTGIVVGMQHNIGSGMVVILPPPSLNNENYHITMIRLLEIARRYYERAQRRIPVEDIPKWLDVMLPSSVQSLNKEIERLVNEKSKYDLIAYVTYGTGEELENAVKLLLTDLGLTVDHQPKGANIDLKAKHREIGLGFAIEVTGTKGIVQKDSDKVAQSWQYLSERVGTLEEQDRLVIVANTQHYLDPKQRRSDSFSEPVVKLLGDNSVLLITTLCIMERCA